MRDLMLASSAPAPTINSRDIALLRDSRKGLDEDVNAFETAQLSNEYEVILRIVIRQSVELVVVQAIVNNARWKCRRPYLVQVSLPGEFALEERAVGAPLQ